VVELERNLKGAAMIAKNPRSKEGFSPSPGPILKLLIIGYLQRKQFTYQPTYYNLFLLVFLYKKTAENKLFSRFQGMSGLAGF
jgi:hypothetical protein